MSLLHSNVRRDLPRAAGRQEPRRHASALAPLAALAVAVMGAGESPARAGATVGAWQAGSAVESADPNFGRSTTWDSSSGFGGDPISRSLTVSRGGGLAHTDIVLYSGGVASTWNHQMAPGHEDAEPRTSYIYEFSLSHDATYQINGFYNATGRTRMSAIIDLWERGPGTRLFRQQIDGTTTDPSLSLGAAPSWPWYSTVVGSQTGLLQAGHLYRLDVDVFLRQGMGGPGVQAGGEVLLEISPVPAPGTGVAAGAALLAGIRRRRG